MRLLWPTHLPKLRLGLPVSALSVPLINLVDNAIKHQVRSENRMVRVDVQLDLDHMRLRLRVQDNSWGITQYARRHLFKPLHSSADAGERNGLGLWLSRHLARLHGGEVDLEWSYRGIGTCFLIELPLALERVL